MALLRFLKTLFTNKKKKKPTAKPSRKHFKKRPKKLKSTLKKKKHKKPSHRAKKRILRKPKNKIKKVKRKAEKPKKPRQKRSAASIKEKEIGIITHYFDKIAVGIIKLKTPLAVGEHIHVKGKNTDFTQVVSSMQYNHKDITLAERNLEIGVRVEYPVRDNDSVFKIIL